MDSPKIATNISEAYKDAAEMYRKFGIITDIQIVDQIQEVDEEPGPSATVFGEDFFDGLSDKNDVKVDLNICQNQKCPHYSTSKEDDNGSVIHECAKMDYCFIGYTETSGDTTILSNPPKNCPFYLEHFLLEKG